MEKVRPQSYASVESAPKVNELKSTPTTHLISCDKEGVSQDTVEKRLRENLRLKDLKARIVSIKNTQKGVAITSKNRDDNRLIEDAIREKEMLLFCATLSCLNR